MRTIGDKQVNVRNMQIRRTTMTTVLKVNHPTSHRNLWHWSLDRIKKENSTEHRTVKGPRSGWDGRADRQKAAKLHKVNQQGKSTWRWLKYACQRKMSHLAMIIDNRPLASDFSWKTANRKLENVTWSCLQLAVSSSRLNGRKDVQRISDLRQGFLPLKSVQPHV